MKISVIIPTYNACRTIVECIESVLLNRYEYFDIKVIDDCSTDTTLSIVEDLQARSDVGSDRLQIIENKVNRGGGFSRNQGILASDAQLFIFLDSDSYVGETWIADHFKAHQDIKADLIGGGIIGVHKTISGRCDGYFNSVTNVPHSKNHYLKHFHLVTNNLSIKKSVFDSIGLLPEDLRTGEDVVFCHKALKNGLKIYYKSDLVIHHYDREGLMQFLHHQRQWGKHAIETRKKYKTDFSFILPDSYWLSFLYIIPLSIMFTLHVYTKWIRWDPKIVFYFPLIYLSKLVHVTAIAQSLKKNVQV